jgi:hypothetical protein
MRGFERMWTLDGVENFRDYGGYSTASGRKMRVGRLYRSAHHAGPASVSATPIGGAPASPAG